MTRLDDYRSALLVASPDVSGADLERALDEGGPEFVSFIGDHGLGPLWHARTGRAEFQTSRLAAEALYLAQEKALHEIDWLFDNADIDYAVIKGGGDRLLLYDNPAIRACHDIDVLVRPVQRIQAAAALVEAGFKAVPNPVNIGHEMTLSKGLVDVDLHWGLLREGRLRHDPVNGMLDRRRKISGHWLLGAEDEFSVLLVHPAFSKHLAGWAMGLHRVLDILTWLRTQSFDRRAVCERLEEHGVTTAGWATLRWTGLLTASRSSPELEAMLSDLRPGGLRECWINNWLQGDLSERTAHVRWARLLGFSLFLHDTPADAVRALVGNRRAKRLQARDLEAFEELLCQ
jgi:hypothetical protein